MKIKNRLIFLLTFLACPYSFRATYRLTKNYIFFTSLDALEEIDEKQYRLYEATVIAKSKIREREKKYSRSCDLCHSDCLVRNFYDFFKNVS